MVLPDVNVLVYAFREEAPAHAEFRNWLTAVVSHREQFALSELVLSGFLRVVTNPRAFTVPAPLDVALLFAERLRSRPNAVLTQPGPRHWGIFTALCERTAATGKLVPDAYFAALAIEHDMEWISTDRDFARFPGLRWRHPLG